MRFLLVCVFLVLFSRIYPDTPKVCLLIEIRNDEDIIEGCLESVKGWIDYAVFCDRGSSDNTRQLIENSKIPNEIVNDLHVMTAARNILKNMKWNLNETYFFVMRPYTISQIEPNFSKKELVRDAYLVVEPSDDLSHMRFTPNFFRASIPWESVEAYTNEPLETVSISLNAKSEYHFQKVMDRIKALSDVLKENPTDIRIILEIGGLFKYLKRYDEAQAFYLQCVDGKGTAENRWFARYMLGECFEEQGNMKNALYWYLEAYKISPERIEPINKLSKYHFKPLPDTNYRNERIIP